MKFKKHALETLKMIFPSTGWELVVFLFYFLSYGTLGSIIAINYRIVFDNRIPWDAYFSFDNRAIVMTGGGFERHPLSNYFFDLIRAFALWISGGKYNIDFRLVLVWFSVTAVSFGMLQVFKYLSKIIGTPLKINVLLMLFFGMFTTPLLLSFTPETYTYTFLFLTFYNHYAAKQLQNNQKISGITLAVQSVLVGGLTITNIVKIYIPILFEKRLFRSWKKFLNAAARVLISAVIFILLYLNRLDFDFQKIFSKTGEQYEKFSKPKVTPIWDMVYSWFFGGNMIFPSFVIRDYHNKKGFQYKALFMDVYDSLALYTFVGLVFLIVFWSWIKNFKNVLPQILMLSFAIDIIIHSVLKFGLHTSYIYGGHFIFVVPLMMGWLFYSFKNSPKTLSLLYSTVCILTVFLFLNNTARMSEFFIFLQQYYQ